MMDTGSARRRGDGLGGRRIALGLALAVALPAAAPREATAAPRCLGPDNPCEPNKLCTFKASLAEKVLIYQIYLRNSLRTRSQPGRKRDGVRYDGRLRDAALAEARERFPNDSPEEQQVKAGSIFQAKVREEAEAKFALPTCRHGGMLDRTLLPKPGYAGMETDDNCRIRANYQGGDYDAATFGEDDPTQCKELYDRDRAHEVIHQRRCVRARERGAPVADIDRIIEEEIEAYRHSVRLSHAYVRLLSLRCSTREDPMETRRRAEAIDRLLSPYLQRQGS